MCHTSSFDGEVLDVKSYDGAVGKIHEKLISANPELQSMVKECDAGRYLALNCGLRLDTIKYLIHWLYRLRLPKLYDLLEACELDVVEVHVELYLAAEKLNMPLLREAAYTGLKDLKANNIDHFEGCSISKAYNETEDDDPLRHFAIETILELTEIYSLESTLQWLSQCDMDQNTDLLTDLLKAGFRKQPSGCTAEQVISTTSSADEEASDRSQAANISKNVSRGTGQQCLCKKRKR